LPAFSLSGKDKDQFPITIDGEEIVIEIASAIRTMDTAADAYVIDLPFDVDDKKLSNLLRPYGYQKSAVYLGNQLIINGTLYNVENILSQQGSSKVLEGWTITADIIDSSLEPVDYEASKISLAERATALCEPFGINVTVDISALDESNEVFDRVTAEPSDTVFSHISNLARQRGVLVTCNSAGELVLLRANVNGSPVATLEEGKPPLQDFAIKFDGRARFHTYRAIGETPKEITFAEATDDLVPEGRLTVIEVDESARGDVQGAADWARSKKAADVLEMSLPVYTWYDSDDNLWEPNTLVTVISPTMGIPDGFNFLIRSVEYLFDSTGTRATLGVVPPTVYTGGELIEPWS
jgi:prophage tail gpP-like protein